MSDNKNNDSDEFGIIEETINLDGYDDFNNEFLTKPFNPKRYKAEAAKWVAKSIVIGSREV